jgi:uncharacterized protein involved in exopolysaccharide biosynthesis
MTTHNDHSMDDLRKTLGAYAAIVRRRWRIALLAAGLVGSGAFWYSQYLPRQYVAATVFERRDDAVLRNLIQTNSPYSFEQMKSSLVLDMTGSRALATAAIRAGLLAPTALTGDGALAEADRRKLEGVLGEHGLSAHVRLLNSSPSLDVIELQCTATDPRIAQQFVTALRDSYIDRTQELISDVLQRTRGFFAAEVDRAQGEVATAVTTLKQRFADFPGLDPTDQAGVGLRLEGYRAERDRLVARQAALDAEISARERFLVNVPEAFLAVPGTDPVTPAPLPGVTPALDRAIANTQDEIAEATTVGRMTSEHPRVRALLVKLEALKAARDEVLAALPTGPAVAAGGESRTTVSPIWQSQQLRVEMELDALRRQAETTRVELATAEEHVQRITALFQELIQGSGEAQQLQQSLEQGNMTAAIWRQHLGQLDRVLAAQQEQRGTQFTLIEEPKQDARPIAPRLSAVIVICTGCGLAAAVLLMALAELFDRSFRSVAQVTRSLNIPVLECVGVIDTPRERRRRLRARLAWTPALGLAVVALAVTSTLAYTSLQRPELHRRAIARLDGVFEAVGAPTTRLLEENHP